MKDGWYETTPKRQLTARCLTCTAVSTFALCFRRYGLSYGIGRYKIATHSQYAVLCLACKTAFAVSKELAEEVRTGLCDLGNLTWGGEPAFVPATPPRMTASSPGTRPCPRPSRRGRTQVTAVVRHRRRVDLSVCTGLAPRPAEADRSDHPGRRRGLYRRTGAARQRGDDLRLVRGPCPPAGIPCPPSSSIKSSSEQPRTRAN